MNYLSICSGIEAASVAWEPLGWEPVGFAEIEPFCNALLKHYWPKVKNYGDFTKLGMFAPAADLLVAGTPCQDFSVAGLREGLDGARGDLTIEWLALVERMRPRWLVWENVPGVLSIDEGRAFGLILARLAELRYGFAYRVLDAQYFRVPQRRRRVFVVGYLGDWRPAAAVLFERQSLCWNSPPRRATWENSAHTLRDSSKRGNDDGDRMTFVPDVALSMSARDYKGAYPERSSSTVVSHTLRADGFDASEDGTGRGAPLVAQTSGPMLAGRPPGAMGFTDTQVVAEIETTHTLDAASGGHATEDGTGRSVPIIPVAFKANTNGDDGLGRETSVPLRAERLPAVAFRTNQTSVQGPIHSEEVTDTLAQDHPPAVADPISAHEARTYAHEGSHNFRLHNCVLEEQRALAFNNTGQGWWNEAEDSAQTVRSTHSRQVMQLARVRRLTPLECERLQGFPDNYTRIRYRGKLAADGPRYRALGNSMAVPVMKWIGERIQAVEELLIKLGRS